MTSQALRDPASEGSGAVPRDVTVQVLVETALANNCPTMTSTYNEPLITSEWAVEIFKEARLKGMLTSYVSNGNATREVLEECGYESAEITQLISARAAMQSE